MDVIGDDHTHVLLLDDYPRWDFRYLRNHCRTRSRYLQYPAIPTASRISLQHPATASASRPFGESE